MFDPEETIPDGVYYSSEFPAASVDGERSPSMPAPSEGIATTPTGEVPAFLCGHCLGVLDETCSCA